MAFVNPPQRLPGVYHQVESVVRHLSSVPARGRVMDMMPLDWFIPGEVVDIHVREWLSNEALHKVGMTFTPDFPNNLSLNALMDGAELGLIFPQNTSGAPASATHGDITITARKHGAAGNEITVNFIEQGGLFTVTTFFRGNPQVIQRVESLDQLQDNPFVTFDFAVNTAIQIGEVMLTGGDSGTVPAYSQRMGAYLEAAMLEDWNVIAFSIDPADPGYLQAINAFEAWLDQFNTDIQEFRKAVLFNPEDLSSDNIFISNLRQTASFDGTPLTPGDMVRYDAGHSAGAGANHSRTADRQARLSNLQPRYNIRQRTNFMNRGFLLYDQDLHGIVTVVRDIGSFVSTSLTRNIQFTDNRTMRTIDAWLRAVNTLFRRDFKGAVDDTEEGRNLFRCALDVLAMRFQESGLIAGHSIDKITVNPGGFRTWQTVYEPAVIPTAVDTLDMITRITWGGIL